MHKFLKLAKSFIEDHHYDDNNAENFRLAAIIVRGGNVVSVGYNRRNFNGFVEYYTDLAKNRPGFCVSTHAEHEAILKAREKTDLRGCKIFVARLRRDGTLAMSRPCTICQHVLYNYGIKRAYYSIDDETYGVMKVVNPAKLYYKDHDRVFDANHEERTDFDLQTCLHPSAH